MDFYDIMLSQKLSGGGGITPTGTITITENGTFDVAQYADADVDVSSGDNVIASLLEKSITAINIPNGTKRIGEYAFYSCQQLADVAIPNTVTSVGGYAFRECGKLGSIDLPESITSIGSYAFRDCESLNNITVRNVSPPSLGSNALQNVPSTCAIFVPSESVDTYKSASGWSARANYIQAIQK